MNGTFSEHFAENKFKFIIFFIIVIGFIVFMLLRDDALVLTSRVGAAFTPPVVLQEGSYAAFMAQHANTPQGTATIEVDIFNPTGSGFDVVPNFEGESAVLFTEEMSTVEFTVNVPQAGLYNIAIEYFPVFARGIDITRELRINGEIPFTGADLITLHRVWGSDPIGVRTDNRGNQIRPPQIELPRWERIYLSDRLGFFVNPYMFYFQAGENTITLTGLNEPLVMRRLSIEPLTTPPTFAEFMATNTLPAAPANFLLQVEGEHSTVRSAPSLFPLFDSSSGITNPPSAALITLNMIGGQPWRIPGQWIEWEFEVPADGLYRISVSARQNYNRGFVSSRSVFLNGEVPFQEVSAVPFMFNNSWELITFADDAGNPLLFPMNEGVNTFRMYVTLGDLGELIDALLASVNRLNEIYREILVLTGPNPDQLRDYRVDYFLPHVMDMIYQETGILYGLLQDLEDFLGERNENTAVISTIVRQLDTFYTRPERIPLQLANFQMNVSALGDSARLLTEGQLDIDFFVISGAEAQLPVVHESFFTRAAHELTAFAASFTMDFDSLGDVHEGDNVIEIWIPTGRDQATVLKSMIDDTFVPNYGIGVNLRLVAHTAVLPAVVAGIGPDAVLSMPVQDPANYAFRNAAVNLTQFPDFWQVSERFAASALVPFEFQGGYYALPETQNFSLMFYREDILSDLGLDIPRTWNDVLAMMPILQRNNMAVGIPPVGDAMNPDISGFLTQLYQRDGFLYNDELSRTILYNEESIAAFEFFTRFFTHFGSPQFYNFVNRFRSGEMPIGFADFTMFNTFSVFAPEIEGLWNFAVMPGYVQADGTINHMVPSWGTAAIMIAATELPTETWQFLRWWTEAETQLRFARELESVMGAAARFPTANLEAFQSLPWSSDQLAVLNEQRYWTLGTPEVPGGYYVGRHLINAIRRVINENVDPRETLLDFSIVINRELINKRREFGLE
ncbi:MAG: extracellular solute-binding protein [Defluviitaleaceae bacterium]|nr:extracellular solute-binding protein [Defluviitaleaceae bacterium]